MGYGLFLRHVGPKRIDVFQTPVLGLNLQYPHLQEGSIRFFTGSNFAQIKPGEKVSKTLFREIALPSVDDIHWLNDGALIKVNLNSNNLGDFDSELLSLLPSNKQNNVEYWFMFAFSSKKIFLISHNQSVGNIKDVLGMSTNEVYFLLDDGSLVKYSLDGTSTTVGNGIDADKIAGINGNEFILSKNDNQVIFYNTADKKTEYTFKKPNIRNLLVDDSGNYLAIRTQQINNKKQDGDTSSYNYSLDLINIKSKGALLKQKGFNGPCFVSSNRVILFNEKNGAATVKLIDLRGGKTIDYIVHKNKQLLNSIQNAFFITNTLYVVDQEGLLSALDIDKTSSLNSFNIPLIPLFESGANLRSGIAEYNLGTNQLTFTVSDQSASFSAVKQEIVDYLHGKNVDGNQIKKYWRLPKLIDSD